MSSYICNNCGTEWGFFPEDYKYIKKNYPKICPHCQMSFWEMVKNLYADGHGIKEIFYWIKVRYFKKEGD